MVNRQRVINDFLELAKIESLSLNERAIADKIITMFAPFVDDIYEDETGKKIGGNAGNIIINIDGDKNIPCILLSAHMDTVGPVEGKNPFVDGDYIRTDGKTILGGDDLAGVITILEGIRLIKEKKVKHGDIQIVISVAEEIGLLGAKNLDSTKIKAKYGFVFDNVGDIGGVAIKAPSHNVITTEILGKAAHAGLEPENGVNAIEIAANAISKLNMGRIDDETTLNVGIIKGGNAINVVCDKVVIEAEIRSLDMKKLEQVTKNYIDIFEKEAKKLGGKTKFDVNLEYKSFDIKENSPIIKLLEKAAKKTGVRLNLHSSGGGSDTNIFNNMGIQSVDLSVGEDKVHSVCEQIKIDDLVKSSEFVVNIIDSIE